MRYDKLLEGAKEFIKKYKYLVIVAAVGLVLLAMPFGADPETQVPASGYEEQREAERRIEAALGSAVGVGSIEVVLTMDGDRYRGALVVCEGGAAPSVRLEVTRAVAALTGLTADKIVVLTTT